MRIQIVMAHPDDEIIFGWPILKKAQSILICSNDLHNLDRAWCRYRYQALQEMGELLGIPVKSLNYPSEFYRLDARSGQLNGWFTDVANSLDKSCDVVYTHNWYGEYGHLDHILVYYAMLQNRYKYMSMMTSDIRVKAGWFDYSQEPRMGAPVGVKLNEVENDLELYKRCQSIYEKYNCWTWSQPPVEKANLILL
jgi:hypothetical protein